MAQNGFGEAVAVAVAATLSTNLTSTLDAIWTEAGDIATVPKPYDGTHPIVVRTFTLDQVLEFPTVQVLPTGGMQVLNDASVWGQVRHQLQVIIYLRSDSYLVLDKQMLRFLRGVWRTIMAHPSLDGSMGGMSGFDFGQYQIAAHQGKPPSVQKAGMWQLNVHVDETV